MGMRKLHNAAEDAASGEGDKVKIVPLYSGTNHAYKEWECEVNGTCFCVVQEDDTWTVLRKYGTGQSSFWSDIPIPVDVFLAQHKLVLAE